MNTLDVSIVVRSCLLFAAATAAAIGGLLFEDAARAEPADRSPSLAPAVASIRDVDVERCLTIHDGVAQPVVAADVGGVLGLAPQSLGGWSAGRVETAGEASTFQYRLAFRRPTPLGAVFVDGPVDDLRLLKDDAPYPGDPADAGHWTSVEIPARQSGARLIPLPPGAAPRALLFVEKRDRGRALLRSVRLLAPRVLNVAPWSLAYADREYVPPLTDFAPFPASSIPAGAGRWENAGKNQEGLVAAPPVTDVSPSWFMLTWRDPQQIAGLWLDSNLTRFDVEHFVGDATINPRAGVPDEWRTIRETTQVVHSSGRSENTRSVGFAPITTRGLRLRITQTMSGPIARIDGLHVFSPLGDRATPAAPGNAASAPPLSLPANVAPHEHLTMVVDTPDGRRIRNLVTRASGAELADRFASAQSPRSTEKPGAAAPLPIGWDLKDETGQFVAPGVYRWTALAAPPLGLKYEMTAYPNVARHAPDNSPWLNGHDGAGGWMADHSPPCSVCVAGDRVFLGSYVAESGVSLIECDLDARKRWGYHSFAAWTGARFLASDQRTLFVAAPILNTSVEAVWTVDLASKKVANLLTLQPTASRRRGLQGIAAADGRLYLSVRGHESWLTGATSADDVDLAACLPLYPPKRKPRAAYEVVPDPQNDFLRLFRLTGTPPGGATQHSLSVLETMSSVTPSQHIVLAFKRPTPIGSVALPTPAMPGVRMTLSVLKPTAPYPPNPDDSRHWTAFATSGERPWDVVPAPENTLTRALRITFARGSAGDDDPLADALEGGGKSRGASLPPDPLAPSAGGGGAGGGKNSGKIAGGPSLDLDRPIGGGAGRSALGFGGDAPVWRGKLEGLKLLRRRFARLAEPTEIRVSSGKVEPDGSWDARRTTPLSEQDPGVYAQQWKSPQKVRGLAIREIDGETTLIDVFVGDAAQPIDIASDAGWQNVARYEQPRRNHHSGTDKYDAQSRYVDGYVDFGREIATRAVRLRVVSQWTDFGPRGELGGRRDLAGQSIDAARCCLFGVAAVCYLGGEPPIDASADERVEVYATTPGPQAGKLVDELPIAAPGELTCDAQGRLHVVSGRRIVRVEPRGASASAGAAPIVTEVVGDLLEPTDLAFDRQNQLYVFDNGAERRQIRVYDAEGKFVRAIGRPGGLKVGPWDPQRLGHVVSLDVDARGQIWAVEDQYHPKRTTVWNTDGTFLKELLGNTPYGGGGVLDPHDKTRLFHGPLELELDWQTGLSRIKHLTWQGATPPGETPIHIDGRTYLVTRPEFQEMTCGVVHRYEAGVARLAAAMGNADAFEPLKEPSVLAALGAPPLTERRFHWSDRNEDGQVQADEVKLGANVKRTRGVTNFNRDLGVQFGELRYVVTSFTPAGVPLYDEQPLPGLVGRDLYRLDDGGFYRFGADRAADGVWSADGRPRWSFAHEGWGVQALTKARPWSPAQVVSQFGVVGHERVDGALGELLVVHSNVGSWNLWTADGLLVGPIFRDLRDPKAQPWSMTAHERGMRMDDVTAGQEHFRGYFCRTSDGKYYVVAGHNHVSILEVLGLEKFRRTSGEVTVTIDDIRRAQQWDSRREQTDLYVRSPVLDLYRLRRPPALDGKLTGFGPPAAELGKEAQFHAGYDDQRLYVAWRTRGVGPLKNGGQQWERIFKSGAAVDLWLATDPQAPPDRQAPAAGDVRLLLTFVDDRPLAVLYRAVAPGAPADQAFRVTSPVGETVIDQVTRLTDVRMVRTGDDSQYVLEASLSLADLGLKPAPGQRLKIDWGVVVSGPEGRDVLRRTYWANRAAQIVADAPSEARLQPHLWGHALVHDVRPTAEEKLGDADSPKAPGGKAVKRDVTDILDDLKSKGS